jgi:hypothetical protein
MEDSRQCSATAKATKARCRRSAIMGGTVCMKHGGSAPQVREKANERLRDMLEDAIDPNRSLREAARIAYSDIRQLFGPDGRFLPIKDWPEDMARCVSSIEFVSGNVDKGDGKKDDVVRVKLWDKGSRIQDMMKHHGQLVEKVEHSGSVDVVQRLAEARKRLNG